ncbi:MAG: hypothetical protein J2P54_05025 [Bradyrhizobiaceae bacterium]|nr:hypothetical protein [Bradyrhizobiaceae bacterium]
MFDTTVRDLPPPRQSAQHPFTLTPFAEPRIEPEIVFRLAAAPSPDMDEAALFGCMDWVAQGFEIVQSVFPGWKFAPADTVIVNGLHGALLLAPRHPAGFGSTSDWVSNLAGFEIELVGDGVVVDRGYAANVFDGPLSALRHLVDLLARDPVNFAARNRRHRHHRHLDPRLSDLCPAKAGVRRFTASSSAAGLFGSRELDVAKAA